MQYSSSKTPASSYYYHGRLVLVWLLLVSTVASLALADDPDNQQHQDSSFAGFNYLLSDFDEKFDTKDETDVKLMNILDRDGPDLRSSANFHDFADIRLKESQRAWRLLRQHTSKVVASKVNYIRPIIRRLLNKTNVSQECQQAIDTTLEGALRLELWAIQREYMTSFQ